MKLLLEEISTNVNVGAIFSISVTVLFDCVTATAFPTASNIDVAEAGSIVITSEPSAIPVMLILISITV